MNSTTEQFATVFPSNKIFQINNETVSLGKIKLRQIAPIIALAKQISVPLSSENSSNIIVQSLPVIADVFAILTDKPKTFYDDIDLELAVDMLQFIIEQNQDLFQKKIYPLLQKLNK